MLSNAVGKKLFNFIGTPYYHGILGKPPSTYINASAVRFRNSNISFIAAMAPKENTIENFWQMVIDSKVSIALEKF